MSADVLRVAITREHNPPYAYRCFTENVPSAADPDCSYPGLVIDLAQAILKHANITMSTVLLSNQTLVSRTADHHEMTSFLRPALEWFAFQMQPLPALIRDTIGIVTTNEALSVYSDPFGMMKPFTWPVWGAIFALILVSRIYSRIFSPDFVLLMRIRRFRLRFRPTFYPIAIGFVLFTGLYKSGLLAKLLLRDTEYLVESIDDVANLPTHVEVMGPEAVWRTFINGAPRRLQDQLTRRSFTDYPVPDAELGMRIQDGDAIFVGPGMKIKFYSSNACGLGLRVVELGRHYLLSFAVAPGINEELGERLNRATEHLGNFAQNLFNGYVRRGPDAADCLLKQADSVRKILERRQVPSFDLSSIRAHFLVLLAGCFFAIIAFLCEHRGFHSRVCSSATPKC